MMIEGDIRNWDLKKRQPDLQIYRYPKKNKEEVAAVGGSKFEDMGPVQREITEIRGYLGSGPDPAKFVLSVPGFQKVFI